MRNVTPTQRMSHTSPNSSVVAQTPVMSAVMAAPQINGGMGLTPHQQQMIRQRNFLAQQGHPAQGQFTSQPIAHMQAQAHAHAQQHLQPRQQHMVHPHQNQQSPHAQQHPAHLMQARLQMQPQHNQGNPTQMTPQQQQQHQMLLAARANGGHLPQHFLPHRYQNLYTQQLHRLRHDMARRLMPRYGHPNQYPPEIAQQFTQELEKNAKAWLQQFIQTERENNQQQHASQAAIQARVMQQQQAMMQNGMGT
jgi:transcription factor SPT20